MAQLQDAKSSLSETLLETARSIKGEQVSLRQLLELVGEQGMLLFCMFLMIPFLVPVSVPGVSTVFSVVVILVGISVTLNRVPWLPARLMDRQFATASLVPALEKGASWFQRIDRFIRPRFLMMTDTSVINRLNGLVFILAGVLLIAPLGLIPFSNTLPALAVLFLAAGMLQRDGFFIILGYVMVVVSVVYFGGLLLAAIAAGQGISSLLGN